MLHITNVFDGIHVNHKLLLINGFFNDSHQVTHVAVKNFQCPMPTAHWPVCDNQLKALCKLVRGANNIEIHCNRNLVVAKFTVHLDTNLPPYTIRPVYIICQGEDGDFQGPADEDTSVDSALRRITLAMGMLQSFYAESLRLWFGERQCFSFASVSENINCEIFRSKLSLDRATNMTARELWIYFAKELTSSVHYVPSDKYVAFMACSRYRLCEGLDVPKTYKDMLSHTRGYAAIGNGGLALIGTPCLFTWPQHLSEVVSKATDETKVDRSLFLDDSSNRGTYWGCYSTTLGATCHEIGHIFDLAHTPDGIMGRGFDDMCTAFVSSNVHHSRNKTVVNFCRRLSWNAVDPRVKRNSNAPKTQVKDNRKILGVHWHPSSIHVIFYHKWFQSTVKESKQSLAFIGEMIISKIPMTLIELRDSSSMVTKFWLYDTKDNMLEWKLSSYVGSASSVYHTIFVIDAHGNSQKGEILDVDGASQIINK